jgi:hypothetical protein
MHLCPFILFEHDCEPLNMHTQNKMSIPFIEGQNKKITSYESEYIISFTEQSDKMYSLTMAVVSVVAFPQK